MPIHTLEQRLAAIKILPVVTPHDAKSTVALAKALLAGGIKGIEITLRTDAALDALIAVKEENLDMQIGAGTVTNTNRVQQVADIGVDFAVSPGITSAVLEAARDAELSLLPGVSSPSEIMLGQQFGLNFFKLFPAGALNGISMLKALYGPFPDTKFCPTGGVNPDNANDYLQLANVVCIGGSWMVPNELIKTQAWDQITQLCQTAMKLVSGE